MGTSEMTTGLSRRKFCQLGLAANAVWPQHGNSGRPPNFIVILADDLGYADISPFRASIGYTPHLEKMASEGLKLTSTYAAPVCTPSRAALLTGCYPTRVGLSYGSWTNVLWPGDAHGLNPDEVTIPKVLRGQGYRSACIGKWHLGDQPEFLPRNQGFDYYFGLPYSNDMGPRSGLRKGAFNALDLPCPPLPLLRNEQVVREVEDQSSLAAEYTAEAIGFLRTNRERPFFLYLAHTWVHGPPSAGKKFRQRSGNGIHGDAVMELDWSTGQIFSELRALGLARNTLVIFTSDNGGGRNPASSNGPLRGYKGDTWEGGLRVPTLACWPGTIPPGSVSHEITSLMDLLPTLASLAGAAAPGGRGTDGHDIGGILFQPSTERSPYTAFFYFSENHLRAVRSGDWKLHASGALYNLAADMGETKDVSGDHPGVVAYLRAELARARADLGDGEQRGPGCRPAGVARRPLRFLIPRHQETGLPPHAPVRAPSRAEVSKPGIEAAPRRPYRSPSGKPVIPFATRSANATGS